MKHRNSYIHQKSQKTLVAIDTELKQIEKFVLAKLKILQLGTKKFTDWERIEFKKALEEKLNRVKQLEKERTQMISDFTNFKILHT